jgi:hypothetical protein
VQLCVSARETFPGRSVTSVNKQKAERHEPYNLRMLNCIFCYFRSPPPSSLCDRDENISSLVMLSPLGLENISEMRRVDVCS